MYVREHISRNTRSIFTIFLHVTHGRGSVLSGGVAIRYVFAILWMTSYTCAQAIKAAQRGAQLIPHAVLHGLRLAMLHVYGAYEHPLQGQWTHTHGPILPVHGLITRAVKQVVLMVARQSIRPTPNSRQRRRRNETREFRVSRRR